MNLALLDLILQVCLFLLGLARKSNPTANLLAGRAAIWAGRVSSLVMVLAVARSEWAVKSGFHAAISTVDLEVWPVVILHVSQVVWIRDSVAGISRVRRRTLLISNLDGMFEVIAARGFRHRWWQVLTAL